MMATPPLTSTYHLEQHDLGTNFMNLVPAFMEVVDSIGFQPDPEAPLFEKCKDNRLIPAAAPLLQYLMATKKFWGVRRVSQATKATIQNPTGALYIVVLRASATAKIEGKQVEVGQSIYLTQMVEVHPDFVCLLLVP